MQLDALSLHKDDLGRRRFDISDNKSGARGFVVDALQYFPEILDKTSMQRLAAILSSAQAESLIAAMQKYPISNFNDDFLKLLMGYGDAAMKEIAHAEGRCNSSPRTWVHTGPYSVSPEISKPLGRSRSHGT